MAEEHLLQVNSRTDEVEPSPEYLSVLAHELRNPLAPIRNAAELLRALCSDPRQLQAVDMIARQVVSLTHMLDDLLDAARLRRGMLSLRKRRIDAAEIVQLAVEVVRPAIDARRQNLFVFLPAQPVQMYCDPVRLEQVVQSLLDNANRFAADGGVIALKAQVEGAQLRIQVIDDGIGIEPDLLPRLFNLFAQGPQHVDRAHGGLGMGLAISRNLVEMHGGTIVAESEGRGRGSRFTVTLPIEADEASGPHPMLEAPSSIARRVLVVDDNPDIVLSLADVLLSAGHCVVTAANGELAVEVAPAFKPEVVILDIGLPGMGGFEVAKALRQDSATEAATLIAMTGYGIRQFQNSEAHAYFDHCLLKPAGPLAVLALIERIDRRDASS
jgi:CheY-like chemotaxis protein